ncbi:hypothetical protein HID58_045959 [Brassica napus]|uniref:Uncharacterized protein n=1 Tax=Brassica napus TaxID=3708 RepID=A0ABQ8AWF3_BRANA|nr:hypothetical protein HID58_045959 [Brassica napus]
MLRWSWLSFMSKHMKEKKRVASDNEDAGTSFRFSFKQSLSLTSFYQFVKVSFKGVESGTGALNLCMICLQTLFTKILSTKFCT